MDIASKEKVILNQALSGFVGRQSTVRFLTSEKGKTLNGRVCEGIGHNGERVQVRMLDDGQVLCMKMMNLAPPDAASFKPNPGAYISDEEIQQRLQALRQHYAHGLGGSGWEDRVDCKARYEYLVQHAGSVPPPSPCMDPMVPEQQLTGLPRLLSKIRACCVGDGTVDFRRFNAGMVGNGEECSVCLMPLQPDQQCIGLPCQHLFHQQCAQGWLSSHDSCPTCRFKLASGPEYVWHMFADYDERITTRLREWVISGMCEMCQAYYQEADPLMAVEVPGSQAKRLVPRSQLGRDANIGPPPGA
mmetsp:Transcript_23567/g.51721  ORF Transcript_23567/g.51721 Transcript_23567/m.51721 type:complete len:302 (+) Transcript_23567:175-1080(+)